MERESAWSRILRLLGSPKKKLVICKHLNRTEERRLPRAYVWWQLMAAAQRYHSALELWQVDRFDLLDEDLACLRRRHFLDILDFLLNLNVFEFFLFDRELLFGKKELGGTVVLGSEYLAGNKGESRLRRFGLVAALLFVSGPTLVTYSRRVLYLSYFILRRLSAYNCMSFGFWILKSLTKVSSSSSFSSDTSGSSSRLLIGE
ncbi:unnamed protein product [Sphagnum jensenii]